MTTRTRSCNDHVPEHSDAECSGSALEEEACPALDVCPVDGSWSEWTEWGECDATCGTEGLITKSRVCNSPPPQSGGAGCLGEAQVSAACEDLQECPGTDNESINEPLLSL